MLKIAKFYGGYGIWMLFRGPLGCLSGLFRGWDNMTYRVGGNNGPWRIIRLIWFLACLACLIVATVILVVDFQGVLSYGY